MIMLGTKVQFRRNDRGIIVDLYAALVIKGPLIYPFIKSLLQGAN